MKDSARFPHPSRAEGSADRAGAPGRSDGNATQPGTVEPSGRTRQYLFQNISKIRSIEPKPVWLRTLEAPVLITFRVLEVTVLIVVCVTTAPFGGGCDE